MHWTHIYIYIGIHAWLCWGDSSNSVGLISGSLPSAPSTEDLVTPKHAAGAGTSPESGVKLPAPDKRALLKALQQQQQELSKLLMVKQQRSKEKSPAGGTLPAARIVRDVNRAIRSVTLVSCVMHHQVMSRPKRLK